MNRKNVIIGLVLFLIISLGYLLYDNLYLKKYRDYPKQKDLIYDAKETIIDELNKITLEGKKLGNYFDDKKIDIKDIKEVYDGKYKKIKGTLVLSNDDFTFENKITIQYRSNGRRYIYDRAYFNEQDRIIYISECDNENIDDIKEEASQSGYNNLELNSIKKVQEKNNKEYEYACEYTFTYKAKEFGGKNNDINITVYKYINCDFDNNCKYKIRRG